MTVATGVGKLVAWKKESYLAGVTAVSTTGAQYVRRVTSDIDLSKDTYESNEIRADYQVGDMRHGMRKVGGSIKGELAPGSYSSFIGALLRKEWVAAPVTVGVTSITGAGTGATRTLTRTQGNYLTDGFKIGHVVRVSAATSHVTADLNKNLFVTGVVTSALTVIPRDGIFTSAAMTTVTITAPGFHCWTPVSGHTNASYSIEHYYSDITKSELFTGCRVNSVALGLPATGMATCDVNVLGAGFNEGFTGTVGAPVYGTVAGTAQYFTTPTVVGTAGLLTAVAGVIIVNGTQVATVTGLTIDVQGGMTTGAVVGSNMTPDVFAGRVKVSGQLTAYFDGVTMRDLFVNETAFGIQCVIYSDLAISGHFISIAMPNCKANGATKSDGEQGLSMTIPFVALYNPVAADLSTTATTLLIQDSAATAT